jgi:hypothetical protein
MASILTCARMADAVYDTDPQVPGWTRVAFRPSGAGLAEAFQGAAFQRGHETIFAFKGTSQGRDAIADVKLGVGMNTYQYASAYEFVGGAMGSAAQKVAVCGHSLGGAIAQIVGNRARLPFVTFNAPGVGLMSRNVDEMAVTAGTGTALLRGAGALVSAAWHPMQAARDVGSMFYRVRGVNFRLGKDVVGSIGVHYGQVVEIPYAGGALDVLAKHKMTTMLEALEGSNYGNRELESVVGAG